MRKVVYKLVGGNLSVQYEQKLVLAVVYKTTAIGISLRIVEFAGMGNVAATSLPFRSVSAKQKRGC